MRLAVLLLLLAAPLARAEPVTVAREARTALALTVYSGDDLALVRDVRRATLAAGEQELRFADVPARLDPRTVSLRAVGNDRLTVREQQWRWDLASNPALLGRWLGREVELVETDERLRTRITPATLLRVDGGLVVQIGDRVVPDPPGHVQLPPLGADVFLQPALVWRLAGAAQGPLELEATYATSGLGWSADYMAVLTADETAVDLTAWVTVTNESGTRYDDASLALIAGQVHRAQQPDLAFRARTMVMAEAAPAPPPAGGPSESGFTEHHRYAFEGRIALPDHATTQLPLLTAAGVPVERRYQVTGAAPWVRSPAPPGELGARVPVRVVVVLRNTAANGLGRPLPAGIVRLWARDASGGLSLVGEDRLAHLPRDETAELTVADASEVIAYRQQTDFRKVDVDPYQVETAFRLTLRNRKDAPVTVRVHEPLDGQWRVLESSLPSRKHDARTLAFEVPVPAGGESVLTWRVQVGR